MDLSTLQSVLEIGETIGVEFKRCGNGIESDVKVLDCMDEILLQEMKALIWQLLCCLVKMM